MTAEERDQKHSEALLEHATDEEARQIDYINRRMNGNAGWPFVDGAEIDPKDVPVLSGRRRELVRAIERRIAS